MFKQLVQENRWFWAGFGLFLIAGAILLFRMNIGDDVLFFSGKRSPFLNFFFANWTKMGEWFPFMLAGIVLLFYKIRHAVFIGLLGASVTLVSFALKRFFEQPRPKAFFEMRNLLDQLQFVDGVQVFSGNTSFPSGHTMGAFALYAFLAFLVPRKNFFGLLFLSFAILVGISRIYLVQHFLKDVYLGAILGTALAVGFYLMDRWAQQKPEPWLDGSMSNLFFKRAQV